MGTYVVVRPATSECGFVMCTFVRGVHKSLHKCARLSCGLGHRLRPSPDLDWPGGRSRRPCRARGGRTSVSTFMYDKLVARAARAKAVQKAKSGRRPVSVYDRYQTRDTNGAPTHQDRNKTRRESLAMHACIKLSLREEPSSQESGAVSGAADDRPRHIPLRQRLRLALPIAPHTPVGHPKAITGRGENSLDIPPPCPWPRCHP